MRLLLLIPLLLTACASPSPQFAKGARVEMTIEGHDIVIFTLHDRAQAIRTNMMRPGRATEAKAALRTALRLHLDCAGELDIDGDQNVMVARCG